MPPQVLMPPMGKIGKPEGIVTGNLRVDFRPADYVSKLEEKAPRWAWTRAAECPCAASNDQTGQPAIDCPACNRTGLLWFGPDVYKVTDPKIGELTAVQLKVLGKGAVIRGLVSSISEREDRKHRLGLFRQGDTMITVRPENRLGFGDRLVCLDAETCFREVVEVKDVAAPLVTRYPIVTLNLAVRLEDESEVVRLGPREMDLVGGAVVWRSRALAPVVGTRISLHYDCYPTYIVQEHPNVFRMTNVSENVDKRRRKTPQGNPADLPLRAKIALEFVPAAEAI